MNKGLMWAGIGLVVLLVGAYIAFGRGGAAPTSNVADTASEPSTLRELMASNAPQKCTFTSANNTSGTAYVAGGKVRGDFSVTMDGKVNTAHTIVVDNTAYVWMDGMTQGFKNTFEATTSSQTGSQGMGPDEEGSYSCEPWSTDANMFVLPTDIEFTAISAAQVQSGAGAVGASCSQCEMITDAGTKAQCKAALNC